MKSTLLILATFLTISHANSQNVATMVDESQGQLKRLATPTVVTPEMLQNTNNEDTYNFKVVNKQKNALNNENEIFRKEEEAIESPNKKK